VLTPGTRCIFTRSSPSDHLFLPKTDVFNSLPPAAPTTADGRDWRRFLPKHGSLFAAETRRASITRGFSYVRSGSCLLESLTKKHKTCVSPSISAQERNCRPTSFSQLPGLSAESAAFQGLRRDGRKAWLQKVFSFWDPRLPGCVTITKPELHRAH